MINPHILASHYVRFENPKVSGGKMYLAAFSSRGMQKIAYKKTFRTATGAIAYANKLLPRWRRLYDAAVSARIGKEK